MPRTKAADDVQTANRDFLVGVERLLAEAARVRDLQRRLYDSAYRALPLPAGVGDTREEEGRAR
jgi:hypothetical protein